MPRRPRHSVRKNVGRKGSQFKPNHPPLFKREAAEVTLPVENNEKHSNILTATKRLKSFELQDVLSVASTSTHSETNQPEVMTYRLRPEKEKEGNKCDGNKTDANSSNNYSFSENENIIVNLNCSVHLHHTAVRLQILHVLILLTGMVCAFQLLAHLSRRLTW